MTALASIRNLAFVGHPSAGKTTLVDALAHIAGASPRKGSVADKTSICDTEPEEQEKQHTLQLATVAAGWGGCKWTFFDTPGYPEFQAEVQSAMYGADLVVGVVSCGSGVTFNLRTKMTAAIDAGRPRALVVTHLDAENADFEALVAELRSKVGEECVPYLLPNASGPAFSTTKRSLDDPESEWCGKLKDRIMDACEDEDLLMEYLETQALPEASLGDLLQNAIARGVLVPILVCNPESGADVDKVLAFFGDYGPSPASVPPKNADGEAIPVAESGPCQGLVLNVKSDPHVGKIVLAKILSGTLHASDAVAGPRSEKGEKLGGLFELVGKKRENVDSAGPGRVVAFSKVEKLSSWDVFSQPGNERLSVQTPGVPTPMVAVAVEPKSRADEQKIGEALQKLSTEDPTFRIEHVGETHQLVVHGMSDLHLQVMLDRMKRRFGVDVTTSLPRIAYRETITKPAEGHHRHRKQSGGRGQFGECYIRLRPLKSGEGVVFTDAIVGGSIPRNLIPAVEKGMREVAKGGILANGQVVDVEVEVYDGKFHAVDSDEASFKIAGGRAFKEGFAKASPVLLEPIMELEIRVPTEHAGTVFSDITSQRRGHVVDQANENGGAVTLIRAEAPLATTQTYHRDLKSQTAGEGAYTTVFKRYAAVPATEQQKVLAGMAKKAEEE